MNTRSIFLIGALALSYIGMVLYLSNSYPEQTDPVLFISFGVLLIGAATLSAFISTKPRGAKGLFRGIKVLLASYAITFGIWMLGSIITLPFSGYSSFELVSKPYFGLAFIICTFLLIPLVAKKLK